MKLRRDEKPVLIEDIGSNSFGLRSYFGRVGNREVILDELPLWLVGYCGDGSDDLKFGGQREAEVRKRMHHYEGSLLSLDHPNLSRVYGLRFDPSTMQILLAREDTRGWKDLYTLLDEGMLSRDPGEIIKVLYQPLIPRS
jgi:hypothetical protein